MWKERKKRNVLSGFFASPLFLSLVLLGLLAIITVPLYKNLKSRYAIDGEVSDLRREIESLESGNQDLKKLLAYLESEQFAEAEARLNFGLKRPGEEVVVIKEDASLSGSIEPDVAIDDASNPVKWLRYFWGR